MIADDYPVWVEHGHDLEHQLFAQCDRLGAVGREVVQHAFHHPGGVCLTGVDPDLAAKTKLSAGQSSGGIPRVRVSGIARERPIGNTRVDSALVW